MLCGCSGIHSVYKLTENCGFLPQLQCKEEHMERLSRLPVIFLLSVYLPVAMLTASAADAGNSALKTFVVTLDDASGAVLSKSQSAAAATTAADTAEAKFGVSLQEEFLTDDYRYEILKAETQENVTAYLAMLELTPLGIIESEFTNSPEFGGGPQASDAPRDGHNIYIIDQEGTFCVYRTDDQKHILEHAKVAGFPADKISVVEHVVYGYKF